MENEVLAASPATLGVSYVRHVLPQQLEFLLLMCGGNVALFTDMKALIRPADLGKPNEFALRTTWAAMLQSMEKFQGWSYESLAACANEYLQTKPDELALFTQESWAEMFNNSPAGLLFSIVNPDIALSTVNLSLARDILHRLANERLIVDKVRHVFNPGSGRGGVPITKSFLDNLNDVLAKVSNTQTMPTGSSAPEGGYTSESTAVELTGLSFIDQVFGGQRRGDVNGILGPTGGGKSTLALHMAVTMAKLSQQVAQAGGPMEPVIFVTAEESLPRLYPRLWSNAFSILRATLEESLDTRRLSTRANLRPYELAMQQSGQDILSEQDRYEQGRVWLDRAFKFIDISGTGDYPTAGFGGVDEIASYVDRLCDSESIRPKAVFIDYAGLVLERQINLDLSKPERLRLEVKRMGDVLKTRVAGRFDTTVWLLHQLKDSYGSESPTKMPTHSDAGDSKGFAVNMATCGALGTTDKRTNCRWLNWSKVRQARSAENSASILQIEPNFSRLVDVTSLYVPDLPSKGFISVQDARTIGGLSAIQNTSSQPRRMVGNGAV